MHTRDGCIDETATGNLFTISRVQFNRTPAMRNHNTQRVL